METSDCKLTFDRDYHEVCQSLINLRRHGDLHVTALGIALGLSYQTVLGMGNSDDFLNQVIAAWLKRQDSVLSQSGEPTWSVLADKLKEMGCDSIAADIRRKIQYSQHKGQQDGNTSATLLIGTSESLIDNQQSHSSLSEQSHVPHCSDQTIVPISTVTQSTQKDLPYTSSSVMCLEQPPVPKRTKLAEESISSMSSLIGTHKFSPKLKLTKIALVKRHQKSALILEQSDNRQVCCTTTSKELESLVTHMYTRGQMLARSNRSQPIASSSLQSIVSVQALNSPLPTSPTCTISASPHQATSLSTSVGSSSQSYSQTLPSVAQAELIKAVEAGEAFRECRADLVEAVVDPLILANQLYSQKVISREILKQVIELPSTVSSKNVTLLDAVEVRIRAHPSDFLTVLAILEHDPTLCVYAEGLRNSYNQICASKASSLRGVLETSLTATKQLNRFLMDVYESLPQVCEMKFPRLPEKKFITLAVIEKESVSRADADTFTQGTLHGHADEILKKKKPIAIEAVLEPPKSQQNMKCVFVEGAPGVGKSTFALEFCRIQRKLGKYSLTLLLRLREKHVQGIKSIGDLFYQNFDLQQAVAREVVACKGKNVLFVLDGFDELPTDLRYDSFLLELIQGKHLPECTVLVTSRPSATADLQFSCKPHIHKHIEILGFTHEHIQQYAESMLSDQPDVLQDFLKYIYKNPAIHGMMYIPLNSAIVLEIYTKAKRTIGTPVPRTITQLYTELCLMLLRKYLVENNDHALADHLQGKLENIPDALRDKILKLGKLALEGALKQQITFKHLPDGCVDLGFMNVTTELYLGERSVASYSFLHLTLQEFLAAFYVSQLPGVEQKLLFIENTDRSWNVHFPFSEGPSSHLNVLWRFMAGLTGFKDIGWKLVRRATQSIVDRHLFVHCLLEIQNEQIIKIACDPKNGINYDAMMRARVERSTHFQHFSVLVSTAHTPFDCYAVGYCMAASGCEWELMLVNIGGNQVVEMLGCGIQAVDDVCGHFSILNIAKNSLTHEAITCFSKFPFKILNQIRELNLSDNQLNNIAFDCLASALSYMVNLTSLNVSKNPGNPQAGGMVKLFQGLCHTKMIDNLVAHEINLGVSDLHALSELLRTTTSLKKLEIGDKNMSPECIVLMIETLLPPSSLENLELRWISYSPESASKWKLLENNTNLAYLNLLSNYVGINLVLLYIAKALHKNKSLKSLKLVPHTSGFEKPISEMLNTIEHYDIESDSIKALSEMLKVNNTLTTLNIFCSSEVTKDNVFTISEALQHNSTLKHLGLTNFNEVINVFDNRITDLPLHEILFF